MTWIDIFWPMMGGASLTVGAVHLFVGLRRPVRPAHLMFASAAFSVAVLSVFELALMQATDPQDFGTLMRWAHIPVAILAVSIIGFVRLHFAAGSWWLGGSACALRVASLVPNFTTGVNVNFQSIDSLEFVPVWAAQSVAVPVGQGNPWMILAQLSNLLLLAFIIHALLETRRRNDPALARRAVLVCGSVALFLVMASAWPTALVLDLVRGPWTVNVLFFVVIAAMGYELSADILRSAGLARKLESSQAELHESEQRLLLATRAAGLGLWTWDPRASTYWFSDIGSELLGKEFDAPLRREDLLAMVHPDDMAAVMNARHEALEGTGEFQCEFRLAARDDQWLAVLGSAERDPTGESTMVRGALLDITEKRKMEQDSALQRDELAHLSRVALLGELSGSIAHELNQPLTAVLSNAQAGLRFLRHEPPNLDEVRNSLQDIVENDKRASDVIRRLRQMLRKEQPDYKPLNVNEVVVDVLRLVNSDILNRSVVVIQNLEADLPFVSGDRVQLQQVLLNLIINACDAMDEVKVGRQLTIGTRRLSDSTIEITVSDQGQGIPEEDIERIFRAFVTTKRDGIGLGLPICRTIVDAHGGSLTAGNNAGAGATLSLVLPVPPSPEGHRSQDFATPA